MSTWGNWQASLRSRVRIGKGDRATMCSREAARCHATSSAASEKPHPLALEPDLETTLGDTFVNSFADQFRITFRGY